MKFKLGQTVMTIGIAQEMNANVGFGKEVRQAFDRYIKCDWGELCQEDREMNDEAIENGERIFAKYETSVDPIYIITEYDRSYTTVLFCNEY